MILTYLFIGVIFTFLVDLLIDRLSNFNVYLSEDMGWDNLQRTFCILLWPFALTVFIVAFIKKYFGD